MKWITVKKANAKGKAIPLGTKGEGDVPASLVGKVQFLPEEAKSEGEEEGDGKMTKDQIAAKLKELGIEFNPADKKEVLAALLPKA